MEDKERWDYEEVMDRVTREPSPLLVMMSYVQQGKPPLKDVEYERLRKEMQEDAKGFVTTLAGLENHYQNQVKASAARDWRIKELREENAELKRKTAELEERVKAWMVEGGKDAGETRIEELIEKTRKIWRDEANDSAK